MYNAKKQFVKFSYRPLFKPMLRFKEISWSRRQRSFSYIINELSTISSRPACQKSCNIVWIFSFSISSIIFSWSTQHAIALQILHGRLFMSVNCFVFSRGKKQYHFSNFTRNISTATKWYNAFTKLKISQMLFDKIRFC